MALGYTKSYLGVSMFLKHKVVIVNGCREFVGYGWISMKSQWF